MAQLDKELFIEYVYYIFLILLHFYTTFFINKTVIWLNVRNYYLNFFYAQTRSLEQQRVIIEIAQENLTNKIIR